MAQKILEIKASLVVPAEEFEQQNGAEAAQEIADVPGLLWKIWIIDPEGGEAGGIYLFADHASYQAYVDGPIVAGLYAYPAWTDVRLASYDYLPTPSAVTRAPVGTSVSTGTPAPTTFGAMAEDAYRTVPTVRAADLQRRMSKEQNLLVIDVRDATDIAQTGTVPGAINISLGTLTYAADNEVPLDWRDARLADRALPVVTTCILGPLGALGGKLLHDLGFGNVQILEGGVQAWIDAGLPVAHNGT